MTSLGFVIGVVTLCLTGAAVVVWLMRGSPRINLAECLALGWMLGVGVVSLAIWIAGFFLRGPILAFVVAAGCGALWVAAWRTARKSTIAFHLPRPRTFLEWSLVIALALQFTLILWVTLKQPLGWDGLLVWEIKARYAFLNDNILPAHYFTSGREYSHPEYPLAIPFAELWLYLWMGDTNQFWVRAIFPMFYTAGMILLALFAARLTGKRWAGLLAGVLFFFVPQASLGTGAASSGYVDFPISVVYCGAIAYLLFYARDNASSNFYCYAACLALLPWFKRDGTILWLVAAAAGAFLLFVRRKSPRMFMALAPGAIVAVAWNIFVRLMHAPPPPEFARPNMSILFSNFGRVGRVYRSLFLEMSDSDNWGVFWLIVAAALLYLLLRVRRPQSILLFGAIILPVVAYSSVYIFSAWPDYLRHAGSSLPRLLIHIMPLLWMAIASAFASPLRTQIRKT
jgi:hypothetical protein